MLRNIFQLSSIKETFDQKTARSTRMIDAENWRIRTRDISEIV